MQHQDDLLSKIRKWLNEQGYPTEFQVANCYDRHGFRVFQGFDVQDPNTEAVREIDVVAMSDGQSREHLTRVCHVVECKWSKDKPWVVLTSTHGQLAEEACVAQTMGNLLGYIVLELLAEDRDLHELDFFLTPDRPGFNGRQVFSQGNDPFYSAMRSITDVSSLLMQRYDGARSTGEMPRNLVLAFPTIVVDGQLFEAFFDAASQQMQVEPRKRVRCHWRGARYWRLHATIDIVTLEHLDDFLSIRAKEVVTLLEKLEIAREEVARCFKERSLVRLGLKSPPHGIPGLLREIA